MKLYAFPPSPRARKVMAVAAHLSVPYELQMVDLTKGEQKKPEYLKLNPNGKMPTLVDGDFVLWESNAIVQYLASKKGNGLWSSDERTRHDISRWLFWDMAHWDPACATLIFEHLVKGLLGLGGPDAARVKEGEDKFRVVAGVLDGHLAGRKWIVGDAPTVADYSIAAPLAHASQCGMPIDGFANIRAWFARVQELDGWKKTQPKA
jgi:glutathione S-transferase